MVLRKPSAKQAGVDHAPEEGLLVAIRQRRQALGGDLVDGLLLFRCGQVEIVVGAPLQRFATAAPREDEVDRREHVGAFQLVDDVQQIVRRQVAVAANAV